MASLANLIYWFTYIFAIVSIYLVYVRLTNSKNENKQINDQNINYYNKIKPYFFTILLPLVFIIISFTLRIPCEGAKGSYTLVYDWLYPFSGWFYNLAACTGNFKFITTMIVWMGLGNILDLIVTKFK